MRKNKRAWYKATRCVKCGRILTDGNGKRILDAIFDSDLLPKKLEYLERQKDLMSEAMFKATCWAWCHNCYVTVKKEGKTDVPRMS